MSVRNIVLGIAGLIGLALLPLSAGAEAVRLETINFTTMSGEQLRLDFSLSGPAPTPTVFHTDKPARIALDFPGVANGLGSKSIAVDTGVAHNINAMEAQGRTRVVLNLLSLVRYEVAAENNHVYLTLSGPAGTGSAVKSVGKASAGILGQSIRNVDFTRGDKGEGRVLISLSDANAVADMRREEGKIVVYIPGASVPAELEKKLDVIDFATPVKAIETRGETGRVKISITPTAKDYDYSSYQSDNLLAIEFRVLTAAEKEERQKKETYVGEKLTLNFQDIPVRQVLQILADFTGLNMVASDTVQGNVTLRLNDVPWDQALDIVLKSKGLAKRQEGNVVRIGPLAEVQKMEQQELEANKKVEELVPLITELIPIKYARASDVLAILQGGLSASQSSTAKQSSGDVAETGQSSSQVAKEANTDSILSERGAVTMDDRTNTLLVKDTAANIDKVRELVAALDVPVRQVMIESRIVVANDNFTRNLGAKLTANRVGAPTSTSGFDDKGTISNAGGSLTFMNSLVDLAAATPQGRLGATILRAGGTLLDLELSAGQLEGESEILSNPRLLTSDGTKALIKQGTQIPYQVTQAAGAGSGGTTTIKWKDAVLMLEVTPHIAPDDNVVLELKITKDSVGDIFTSTNGNQNPVIDTKEVQTNVQVADGDTVVLGGVYEDERNKNTDKIPWLSDIPGLGYLFQRKADVQKKRELLVFITPKIVRQALTAQK